MSNFGLLKSENGHFWIDYFQIMGKSLTFNLAYMVEDYLRSSITTKKTVALQCNAFSVNLCKCPILVELKSENGQFWIDYFQIGGKSLKSIMAYMVGIIWGARVPPKKICSPMQCFFCKLVQMSNFDRLNSANEHISDRFFPNLRQIPKIHLAYMVGTI